MTDALSRDVATAVAERFGLIMAVAADNRSISLLFTGEKANEAAFREVLSHMLMDHGVTHQFPPDNNIPGIYARGLTLPGTTTRIYLVVVGDADAARYALIKPATRGE